MDTERRIAYDQERARIYSSLGIDGTTYEIGFRAVARLVGNVSGLTLLDFGAGSGRSSRFLLGLGASRVYAIDHNEAMIAEGRSACGPGIEYRLSHNSVPLDNESVDGAISLSVFIELASRIDLYAVCQEIHRVLKIGCTFIVMTTNPDAFGHRYLSFEYELPRIKHGGSRAICRIKSSLGSFEIEDTYWTERDYIRALEAAGFVLASIEYPAGSVQDYPVTEEGVVPPFLIAKAIKLPAERLMR